MIHGLLRRQLGDRRQHAKGICSQENDVLSMAAASLAGCVGNVGDGIGGTRILGQATVIQVNATGIGIDAHIFQDRAKATRRIVDLGFSFGRQTNRLGIAAAFKIEDACVAPTMLIITDERAVGIGGERGFAGTERGVTEPEATFSACFGAPFMAQRPSVYAKLLGKKIEEHNVNCWLVNTGWTGGPYGVGHRMAISDTRAMVNAALDGELNDVEFVEDPIFGLQIPTSVPGVSAEVLQPRNTWDDGAAYDAQAKKLAGMFVENFKQFEENAPAEVTAAGPKV